METWSERERRGDDRREQRATMETWSERERRGDDRREQRAERLR
jgi:hypothetical protein